MQQNSPQAKVDCTCTRAQWVKIRYGKDNQWLLRVYEKIKKNGNDLNLNTQHIFLATPFLRIRPSFLFISPFNFSPHYPLTPTPPPHRSNIYQNKSTYPQCPIFAARTLSRTINQLIDTMPRDISTWSIKRDSTNQKA